jgi:hypothetical protein
MSAFVDDSGRRTVVSLQPMETYMYSPQSPVDAAVTIGDAAVTSPAVEWEEAPPQSFAASGAHDAAAADGDDATPWTVSGADDVFNGGAHDVFSGGAHDDVFSGGVGMPSAGSALEPPAGVGADDPSVAAFVPPTIAVAAAPVFFHVPMVTPLRPVDAATPSQAASIPFSSFSPGSGFDVADRSLDDDALDQVLARARVSASPSMFDRLRAWGFRSKSPSPTTTAAEVLQQSPAVDLSALPPPPTAFDAPPRQWQAAPPPSDGGSAAGADGPQQGVDPVHSGGGVVLARAGVLSPGGAVTPAKKRVRYVDALSSRHPPPTP